MGEHDPAALPEHVDVRVVGAPTGERVGVDDAAPVRWQGEQVCLPRRGIEPTKCSPVSARYVKFAAEFCPASKTTVGRTPRRRRSGRGSG